MVFPMEFSDEKFITIAFVGLLLQPFDCQVTSEILMNLLFEQEKIAIKKFVLKKSTFKWTFST